jgi:hypothetical protein
MKLQIGLWLAGLGLLLLASGCELRTVMPTLPPTLPAPASGTGSLPETTPQATQGQLPPPQITTYPGPQANPGPPAEAESAPPQEFPTPTEDPLAAAAEDWLEVAPGVDYRVFNDIPGTVGPVHVARMSRDTSQYPNLTLDTLKGDGFLQPWTLEGVDGQVQRYEDTINYWGDLGQGGEPFWGKRNHIVAAINGSLMDINDLADENKVPITIAGYPNQGMVQSGWYFDRFQDHENRSGFVWTMSRRAFIGGCVTQPGSNQSVLLNLLDPDSAIKITGVNVPRTTDLGLFLYTPQYGVNTGQKAKKNQLSVEVVVRLHSPLLILPSGETDTYTGKRVTGEIVDVRINQDPAPIEFDQIVLSAYGSNAEKLQAFTQWREGQWVGINTEVVDGPADNCRANSGKNWTEAYAALGVDVTLVSGGEAQFNGGGFAPRSAVGLNDEFIYFIAAEGHPYRGEDGVANRTGITLFDLAQFLVDELDIKFAANLDGGGSTTMVINDRVVTRPGDLLPMICTQSYLSGVNSSSSPLPPEATQSAEAYPAPTGQAEQPAQPALPSIPGSDDNAAELGSAEFVFGQTSRLGVCQRPVINSLAMISTEPFVKDRSFKPGTQIYLPARTRVRQGPGRNYGVLGSLPSGSVVQVGEPGSELNGIYATGTYWWYIETENLRGWVDEAEMAPYQGDQTGVPGTTP